MKIKMIAQLFLLFIVQYSFAQTSPRTIIDFNNDWKFFLGDDSAAINPNYSDAKWRTLTLPHNRSIEGAFSKNNPASNQ